MAKASPKDVARWKNLILEQMNIGMTIPDWCRQNNERKIYILSV